MPLIEAVTTVEVVTEGKEFMLVDPYGQEEHFFSIATGRLILTERLEREEIQLDEFRYLLDVVKDSGLPYSDEDIDVTVRMDLLAALVDDVPQTVAGMLAAMQSMEGRPIGEINKEEARVAEYGEPPDEDES